MPATANEIQQAALAAVADPELWVMWNYPWGVPNTPLAEPPYDSPDEWQLQVLRDIRDGILSSDEAIQLAVASGHGIGKSALIGWIIDWFANTRTNPQIVCTANTSNQLQIKTWRELKKWHDMSAAQMTTEWTATSYRHKLGGVLWAANAVPWSKENSEAFAGTHDRHVLMLFDEASMIDRSIWEVAEGAMTTPGAIWIVFGNPTRSSGRFRECFSKFRERWITRQIDSRDCKIPDKRQIAKWAEDYGEDSDFFKVRVRGQFPSLSDMSVFSIDRIDAAWGRKYPDHVYAWAPKIMSLDVARSGANATVLFKRQGLMSWMPDHWRIPDLEDIADRACGAVVKWHPDVFFVDANGIGAGVYDKMRKEFKRKPGLIRALNPNAPSRYPKMYYNRRSEAHGEADKWLGMGGCLPKCQPLYDDMISLERVIPRGRSEALYQVESKEHMQARNMQSPDFSDAFVGGFYEPVVLTREEVERRRLAAENRAKSYDPTSHFTGRHLPGGHKPINWGHRAS